MRGGSSAVADIAVIGAGVGGLTAAIELAVAGHRVAVFEALGEVGGKLGRVVIDGVEADTGPSVLTMPEVFDELFRRAGTSLEAELSLVAHDALGDLQWPDGTRLVVHREAGATVESVRGTLGADAAGELAAFLRYAQRIWDAAAPAFVYGDAPTLSTAMLLGVRAPMAMGQIDALRSMQAGIERHVREPHLRDLLARYATYNGSDPRRAPATLNCIAHVELTLGCYGVQGGMYELARALERVAQRQGVTIHVGTPVRGIVTRDGGVDGVDAGNRLQRFDGVVANADAAHVFGELLQGEPPDTEPSMSGWTALVRTSRKPRLSHGVLFPGRYAAEFEDIFDLGIAPRDPTVYVCAQEVAHGRQGAADAELLFCMANAPAVSRDRGTDIDALRGAVLHKLRAAGWIDASATVVWERAPAGLAAQFPGTDGAIYGASSNSRFAAFRRPANRVAGTRGLYLASGSAHPGGGVPLCALSGRAAARAAAADLSGS